MDEKVVSSSTQVEVVESVYQEESRGKEHFALESELLDLKVAVITCHSHDSRLFVRFVPSRCEMAPRERSTEHRLTRCKLASRVGENSCTSETHLLLHSVLCLARKKERGHKKHQHTTCWTA